MSIDTLPREDRVCLLPDAYNIGLLRDGGMPNCPCCQGTATTFSHFFPHSGIYQAYVHCAHCDVQVFKNARDLGEARRLAADTWAKRPAARLSTSSPDSGERMREADFLTRWYYAGSEDAEHWFVGGDTREAAIQAGRDHYDGEQEAFAISAGTPMRHQLDPFTDDVEGVINAFQSANEELFGEDGQGDPENDWTDDQCRDLARRLNATFAEWAKDHGHDKAYMLDLSKGEIVPAALQESAR